MRKLFAGIVCFSLCAVMASAGGGKGGLKLDGAWTATASIIDGKTVTYESQKRPPFVVTIKENKYTVSIMGKEVGAGTFTIDAKMKPTHLTLREGDDNAKTQLGLIKVDGDVMTIAFDKKEKKERPKNFEGSGGFEVTIFKRGK